MCISEFSEHELVLLSTSLSIAISKEFDKDEITVLAAFFTALGDNLALLSL